MTIKTWNGSNADFAAGVEWSPAGVPTNGDTAVITAGNVTETGALPAAFLLQIVASTTSSPSLTATTLAIAAGSAVEVTANSTNATLDIRGASSNNGSITMKGLSPGLPILMLLDPATGTGGTSFTNAGGLTVLDTAGRISVSGNQTDQIVNTGTIALRSTTSTAYRTLLSAPVTGTGTIRLGANETLQTRSSIGTGQTVLFEPGVGKASALQADFFNTFQGKIAGFGSSDSLSVFTLDWNAFSYAGTTSAGTLSLTANGAVVQTLSFIGNYTTSSFTLGGGGGNGGLTQTTIATTVADAPQTIAFTDVVSNISGADVALPYSDPNVPYLQYTYAWNSPDAVAISTTLSNVFLHGGPAGDALQVSGGRNVLDGGGGSNFLVGATGSDGGSDVFFVDGRNQVNTWSTIVNFHKGDIAVIFGFKNGVSTQPWIASDGTAGYTGATLHSELNGAGTGVNASFTLTGISLATQQGFEITYGSQAAQGNDYILVKYV